MRYQDFEGSIEELVLMKIREIEEKERVRVLHVVESGSRSWGFASPDSDYDIRFIYVRDTDYYLSLQDKKDFIDWELDEVLDINGWDLKKALQYFHKSSATMFEWANSPIVYYTTPEWEDLYEHVAKEYFACKPQMYHYYGTAIKNYQMHISDDMVKYKKYFYVLRPLLSCLWIEKKKCPPSIVFSELVDEVLPTELLTSVSDLIEKKMTMSELDKGARIKVIDKFIETELVRIKALLEGMVDDRKEEWEPLEKKFIELTKVR